MGETGCRAEGVGAPARGNNPLTAANLLGMGTDAVSGAAVGRIVVTEKGGKRTEHFLKPSIYVELEAHIALTPELVLRFLGKHPGSEVLSLKPGPALNTVIWKNGLEQRSQARRTEVRGLPV